jgi:hypothetical protein
MVCCTSLTLQGQSSVHRLSSLLVNSDVHFVETSQGYTLLSGDFTQIGPYSGSGIVANLSSGAVDSGYPKISGAVNAVVSDGNGGWYVGGQFTGVDNKPIRNLIHIKADKTLDQSWLPDPKGTVETLYINNGILYVGGNFQKIASQSRNFVASFSLSNGALTNWNPNCDALVSAIHVRGTTVYIGGQFTKVAGVAKNKLAAVDNTNGTLINTFVAEVTGTSSRVSAIASSTTKLYIGGYFNAVNGVARNAVAAVDLNTGAVDTNWNADPQHTSVPSVFSLLVDGNRLYAGGWFDKGIGGLSSLKHLGSVDLITGNAFNDFTPDISSAGGVRSMTLSGTTLFITGGFYLVNDTYAEGIAALQTSNGSLAAWTAPDRVGGIINCIAADDRSLFIGGDNIMGVNWANRYNVAVIEEATGQLWPYTINLGESGYVYAMCVQGTTLYIAGQFDNVNGEERTHLAAFDLTNGNLLPWNPLVEAESAFNYPAVHSIAWHDNKLYIGGRFYQVNGAIRPGLAAIDATTGGVTSWNPVVGDGNTSDQMVYSIDLFNNILYVAGEFQLLGGQARGNIGAVDASTGGVLSWSPNSTDVVYKVSIYQDKVYVAGDFSDGIGGESRFNGIARLDLSTGSVTPWDIDVSDPIADFAFNGDVIFVGGYFDFAEGENRPGLASFSIADGKLTAWLPDLGSGYEGVYSTQSLSASSRRLYVGGSFIYVGEEYRRGYAEYDICAASTGSITFSGTTLTAPEADLYQWYKNDQRLENETSRTLEINLTEYGIYRVDVTINGCATSSAEYTYLITDTENNKSDVQVYPNPVQKEIYIEVRQSSRAIVYDMTGHPVHQAELSFENKNRIETSNWRAGAYILIVQSGTVKNYFKVIKTL